eukprot:COSAG02_NODE_30326_length_553_cov_0.980176_1_plen_184_part_11
MFMVIGVVLTCGVLVVGTLKSKAYKQWTGTRVYKQAAKQEAKKFKQQKVWAKAEKEIRAALSESTLLKQQQQHADGADNALRLAVEKSLAVLKFLDAESSYPLLNYIADLRQAVALAQAGIGVDASALFSKLERVLSVIAAKNDVGPPQIDNFVTESQTPNRQAHKIKMGDEDNADELAPLKKS